MMNENKGVFGLNMLKWWDAEGSLDRVIEPLMADLEAGRLEPVVAEAFPFERAGDAHRFIAERRNVGKVVLFPRVGAPTDRRRRRLAMKKAILLISLAHSGGCCRAARPRTPSRTDLHGAPGRRRRSEHDPHLAHARTAAAT